MMDSVQADQGIGWAHVASLILARHGRADTRMAQVETPLPGRTQLGLGPSGGLVGDLGYPRPGPALGGMKTAPVRQGGFAPGAPGDVGDGAPPGQQGRDTVGAAPGAIDRLGPPDAPNDRDRRLRHDAHGLTEAEQAVVDQLKARDAEVRRHEQAHAAVGGEYASAPSYTFEAGPDGRQYAVGGEVQIDVAPVADDPAATIIKMEVVKAAALAPAEPSSADRQVAALADARRAQAVADLIALRTAERAARSEGAAYSVRR